MKFGGGTLGLTLGAILFAMVLYLVYHGLS